MEVNFRVELLELKKHCYKIRATWHQMPSQGELADCLFEYSEQWKKGIDPHTGATYKTASDIRADLLLEKGACTFFDRKLHLKWVPNTLPPHGPQHDAPVVGNYRGLTLATWGAQEYTEGGDSADKFHLDQYMSNKE